MAHLEFQSRGEEEVSCGHENIINTSDKMSVAREGGTVRGKNFVFHVL